MFTPASSRGREACRASCRPLPDVARGMLTENGLYGGLCECNANRSENDDVQALERLERNAAVLDSLPAWITEWVRLAKADVRIAGAVCDAPRQGAAAFESGRFNPPGRMWSALKRRRAGLTRRSARLPRCRCRGRALAIWSPISASYVTVVPRR